MRVEDDQIVELLHLTRRNLVNIGLGLFKENMKLAPSLLHYALSDALICSEQSTAFAMPRGFGKSTYAWELTTAWNILHRKYRYIMFIGSTTTIAEEMFQNIRSKVLTHPILTSCITDVKSNKNVITYSICGVRYRLACYGAGQQLRGKRFEDVRPELVVMDDLETTEGTRSQEQRRKMKDWFFADVLPLDVNCRFFFIGTYLHEDCLLANIIDKPPTEERTKQRWKTFKYGVLDYEKGTPTWPEKYDETWIDMERKKYIEMGMVHRFNTEYMNIAVDRKDRAFDPARIRFYGPEQLKAAQNNGFDIITIVDPGIHPEANHDPTVIFTSAMDSLGQLWIINIERKRMIHHEILDEIVKQYKEFNPRTVYIEAVQAQQYLVQDLEHGTWPGGHIIPVEKIEGKQVQMGKLRIYGIEGLFHNRKILVPASASWWPEFVNEMVTFPRGRHDDMLDCLAYAKMNHQAPSDYQMDYDEMMARTSPTVF